VKSSWLLIETPLASKEFKVIVFDLTIDLHYFSWTISIS
jgi:hypothetical protein